MVVQMYQHVNSFALVAKKLNHHLMQRARKLGVHDSGKWDPVPKLFLDVRNCPLDRYSKEFYQNSSSYSHNDLVFCDNRQKIERSPYRVNFTFIIKSMSPFAYRGKYLTVVLNRHWSNICWVKSYDSVKRTSVGSVSEHSSLMNIVRYPFILA